ncbi:trigger factor [Pikeienuella piscinae]|uniref:Trigger factor n=1 Tax=Pikeienuella piscinae TaxID=2748098 RepID=A0A7L5BUW0_9RHOB|nr:trigger factor [Pikeienuella piscinae]QIE54227.1 trigger factor [Pikeienuella piscinae]
MQVTETLAEGLKREYAMTLAASDLAEKMDAKIDAVRADFQMKGFRKGKAPKPLLKKMFGKNLMGEVVDEAVNEAMRSHFDSSGDTPSQQPEVSITNERFDEGDDLNVTVKYERLPDVPDAEFGEIKLTRLIATVGDAEVDEAVAKLAEQSQSFSPREEGAKAEDGDQVTFDFLGKVDGEPFEGGAAEDYPLVLGSGQFIPGFEEQLAGVVAGEEKAVEVTFPAEYGVEALAGKPAVFECKIKEVAAPAPAEINDEMAKKFGLDDLAALRAQMKERLEAEYKGAARQLLKRELLDALDDAVSFELPEGLVTAEANAIAHQLWHEENPDHKGHDHPEIEPTDEHKTIAERRVRLGLLLAEVGKKAEIEVSEGELNQAIFRQAQQMPGQEKAFFDYVRQNPQMLQQMRAPIFEDKVVDYIVELADVTEKEVTKAELEAAIEALDDE